VTLQFLQLVSQQYAADVALLQKNEVTILIKWQQGLTHCQYLKQVTPHLSMTIKNRNSARYTFNVYAHTAAVLLPQQIMLGFGVYFSLSWTVPSAAKCLLLPKISYLHNSGKFYGCPVLKRKFKLSRK